MKVFSSNSNLLSIKFKNFGFKLILKEIVLKFKLASFLKLEYWDPIVFKKIFFKSKKLYSPIIIPLAISLDVILTNRKSSLYLSWALNSSKVTTFWFSTCLILFNVKSPIKFSNFDPLSFTLAFPLNLAFELGLKIFRSAFVKSKSKSKSTKSSSEKSIKPLKNNDKPESETVKSPSKTWSFTFPFKSIFFKL